MVIPADGGGGGGASTGGSDLERGVGALKRFQSRVKDLLADLERGAAGDTKVAAQTVARTSLSGSNATFAEADGLYAQYSRVHQSLVSLSRTLGDQIETLSIGVHAAEVGFDNVEEDVRRRYARIQTRILEDRRAEEKRAQQGEHGPEKSGKSNSEQGW
ncbi:hypothetical protein OG349_09550 [Streptomyces sp. NBC_01317]|uniref:hypothetical protein n=1 Tax=Streptomyces sp. NBC_01317 TaxID=2903822 RepID=UPI002E14EA27|nr:hypothetical protein OG349_09550 [Streptomyces sp. NBC_01317]